MSEKLHLICMKPEGFHAKIRCNLNVILTFNSYNYNFFFILSYSVFIIMFS